MSRDRLFFYGPGPGKRLENRDNLYTTPSATRSGASRRSGSWLTRRGGSPPTWSSLWTPTKSRKQSSATTARSPTRPAQRFLGMSRTRGIGYGINQVNTSGTVEDMPLSPSAYFSVRGGSSRPLHRCRHSADHQLPLQRARANSAFHQRNFENTPRALIDDFDTTKRSNVNVNYNRCFSALGNHSLRAGYGFQHVVNDVAGTTGRLRRPGVRQLVHLRRRPPPAPAPTATTPSTIAASPTGPRRRPSALRAG